MLLVHPGFVHSLEPAKDAASPRRRSSPPETFQRGGPKGRNDLWIRLCWSRGDDRKHLPYTNSSRLSLLLLLLFVFLQFPAESLDLPPLEQAMFPATLQVLPSHVVQKQQLVR